ncbi:MAG: CocE/NonD family hydrolase [Candidatus Thermoplasmatota archaeon]|nr:CocE/NonD family hydrolase [Candidatus Thermoplasmatota archaeon]
MKMSLKKLVSLCIILLFITVLFSGCLSNETVMVEMRDGIQLATDVYLPSNNGEPHGTLLVRTPYNKNDMRDLGKTWAKLGWPNVIQDMRGRYQSEGIDTVFRNAHTDGPDTLAWIADQSFSNGKIATFGGSAKGINQYYMAGANPDYLACQYVQVATPNLYNTGVQQGGQLRWSLVPRWLEGQNSLYMLDEYLAHENYSLDYWGNVSLENKWSQVNVPAIHIGGWYDCFAQGSVNGFMGYQYQGGPGAQGNSKLIMGPWTHGGGREQGELVYPENAMDNFSIYMFSDMIEQYTMDNGNRFDEWPSVLYYVMGDVTNTSSPGNVWLTADDWPVAYDPVSVFMTASNGLTDMLPTSSDSFTYDYDPTDPVPTIGGQNLNIKRGPYDQREVENRDDVIVFSTDVLSNPVWIAGPVKARLFVSSDCVDTDFTVKLTDVYPDGRSMLITDSVIRMRNRNGYDHWEFMESGEIYEIEIDLWSTAYLFNKGHQIRVSVSSSNSPRFLPNPNTKDGWMKNETYQVAENTVYVGDQYPSQIILPLVTLDYEKEEIRSSLELAQSTQGFLQTHPLFQFVGKDIQQSVFNKN